MSLDLSYNQLQKAIGRYLGYGRGVYGSDNGSDQWADIQDCIDSGLRQFYNPPRLPGQDFIYHWHFLTPTGSVITVSGTGDYDLPSDLGGIQGDLTYPAGSMQRPVVIVSESAIRTLRQKDTTSNPTHAAIIPKATDGTSSQVNELLLFPTPDSQVELKFKYFVKPSALTQSNPYPYGGSQHGETILESCLSIAEQRLNDDKGLHWEKFLERLSASIQYDMKTSGADFLGYNSDNSDVNTSSYNRLNDVTVNGLSID
jgi:hypothetical protein